MSKKVLIISGSPRKGGNSDKLCDRFAEGARDAGHNVVKVSLADCKVGFCTGCGCCSKTNRCTIDDDVPEIVGRMMTSDVIVMASPVYFYSVYAQIKALIDRSVSVWKVMRDKAFYYVIPPRRIPTPSWTAPWSASAGSHRASMVAQRAGSYTPKASIRRARSSTRITCNRHMTWEERSEFGR